MILTLSRTNSPLQPVPTVTCGGGFFIAWNFWILGRAITPEHKKKKWESTSILLTKWHLQADVSNFFFGKVP